MPAFQHGIELVGIQILNRLDSAGRPANFHGIYFRGLAKTEMDALIVLRKISSHHCEFRRSGSFRPQRS